MRCTLGGRGEANELLDSVEMFNGTDWTLLEVRMGVGRCGFTAAPFGQ